MRRLRLTRLALLLTVAVAPGVALAGCADDEGEGGAGADIEDFPESTQPRMDDLELAGRIGEEVTVTARVGGAEPHAFGLGGGAFGEDPVLVVGRDLPLVASGDTVRVTGTARQYSVEALEAEIDGEIDGGELDDDYEYAIVAEQVEVVQPAEAAGEER